MGHRGLRIAVSVAAKGGEGFRLPLTLVDKRKESCNSMLEQALIVKLSIEGYLDPICMAHSAACSCTVEASYQCNTSPCPNVLSPQLPVLLPGSTACPSCHLGLNIRLDSGATVWKLQTVPNTPTSLNTANGMLQNGVQMSASIRLKECTD